MSEPFKALCWCGLFCLLAGSAGCMHSGWRSPPAVCNLGETRPAEPSVCPSCESAACSGCADGRLRQKVAHWWSRAEFRLLGWACKKSNAIPETLPLGSTVRSHVQVMQTNAEASDFILHRHDFVGQTPQLTPDGKDHLLEIAARMRSEPFPVLVERSSNNADPELDAVRRDLVAQILTDLGNADAQQRTVVAPSYSPGYTAIQAEQMYYQHLFRGGYGGGNFGNNLGGNFGNSGGGFAGGGFF